MRFDSSANNGTFDIHFVISSSLEYILSARPTELVLYKNASGTTTRVWTK